MPFPSSRRGSSSYLGIDAGRGEFVLHDHDDDAEHSHDEGIVGDPLPLLEQGLPATQTITDVGAVALGRGGSLLLLRVSGVFGVDSHQGDVGRIFTVCISTSPLFPSHRAWDAQRRHRLPQLIATISK